MAPVGRGSGVRGRGRSKREQAASTLLPWGSVVRDHTGESASDPQAVLDSAMVMMKMEDLQKLMSSKVADQQAQGMQDKGFMSEGTKYLRDFRNYNPPSFSGKEVDSSAAESWMMEAMERVFRCLNCPEEHKVHCGIFMLTERALLWWRSAERSIDVRTGQVTWPQFKEAFFTKYYPAVLRFKKHVEFLHFELGERTVEDYELEFIELSQFCPELVDTDAKKTERFIMRLRVEIQGVVVALAPPDYAAANRVASLIDARYHKTGVPTASSSLDVNRKRKVEQLSTGTGAKAAEGSNFPTNKRETWVQYLRKVARGRCMASTGACYRCGM